MPDPLEPNRKARFARLKDAVENDTAWSGGTHYPWQGDALVTPWLLEQLVLLASHAPTLEIDALIQELQED